MFICLTDNVPSVESGLKMKIDHPPEADFAEFQNETVMSADSSYKSNIS